MLTPNGVEKCLSYIRCLSTRLDGGSCRCTGANRFSITISRQTGSGAMIIADKLAERLQKRVPMPYNWTVFDHNLVEEILKEHNLPAEIAKFMPEDKISATQDMIEELIGLHPSAMTLTRQTTETILHLATLGNVILVGRGSAVVTRKLKNVFHVRLIAPVDQRIARVMQVRGLDRTAAERYVEKEDIGRKRFVKEYFHADVEDNLLYDLVLNLGRFTPDEAVGVIESTALVWAEKLR